MAALTDARVAELFDADTVVMAGGAGASQWLGDDDAACVPGVVCGKPETMRAMVESAGPGGPMVGGARQTRRKNKKMRRHRRRRQTQRRIRWPSGRWRN